MSAKAGNLVAQNSWRVPFRRLEWNLDPSVKQCPRGFNFLYLFRVNQLPRLLSLEEFPRSDQKISRVALS